MEVGIEYSKAQVPERSYYADYCEIERGRTGLSFFFGKLVPGTSKLRTKIEIAFPDEMVLKQLWYSSRNFHDTVRKTAELFNLEPVEQVEDTDKVQTFRANNVLMAAWGEEAVMDFYYLCPRDVHQAPKVARTEVDLEPIVRVVLSTALIFEFLEKCRPHIERLKSAGVLQPQEI